VPPPVTLAKVKMVEASYGPVVPTPSYPPMPPGAVYYVSNNAQVYTFFLHFVNFNFKQQPQGVPMYPYPYPMPVSGANVPPQMQVI